MAIYEERHLISYNPDQISKSQMSEYLQSIGLGTNIIQPHNNGAIIVRIPQSEGSLVRVIQEHFEGITIAPDPLPKS